MRWLLATLVALWFMGFASQQEALAATESDTTTPSAALEDDSPVAYVLYDQDAREWARLGGGGSGPAWVCHYYAFIAAGGPGGIPWGGPDLLAGPIVPDDGEVAVLQCTEDGDLAWSEIVVFDPGTPLATLGAAQRARDLARSRLDLPLPTPAISPPAGVPHLVGVPTWLAVGGPWTDLTTSATLAGVTSTVIARPTAVTWDPGDGAPPVTCEGPGTTWEPDGPLAGPCTHTWRYASRRQPTSTYPLTATVTWEVTWSASTGAGGALGTVTTTSTWPITVHDAQAVID